MGAVHFALFGADDKIGDFRAVFGGRFILLNQQILAVEIVGQALHLIDLLAIGGDIIEGGRSQIVGESEEKVVGKIISGRQADGAIVRGGDLFAHPLAILQGVAEQFAHHIGQFQQQQRILGRGESRQTRTLTGLENNGEIALAHQEPVIIDADQGTLPAGAAAGGPVGFQLDQQLVLENSVETGILRDIQLDQPAALHDKSVAGVEAHAAGNVNIITFGLVVDSRPDAHIRLLPLE